MIKNILRDLKKQIKFDDQCVVIKDFISNPNILISWYDVEEALNYNLFKFEIIQNGNKLPIPEMNYFWYSKIIQDKKYIYDFIINGNAFVILEYRNKEINNLLQQIENFFDVLCDAHIYGGISEYSKSFTPHVDIPPNFILQIEGTTTWKIYKNCASDLFSQEDINSSVDKNILEIDKEVILSPGDILYIPSRRFHEAIPTGKRLSISIPCRPKKYDRSMFNLDRNYYEITS